VGHQGTESANITIASSKLLASVVTPLSESKTTSQLLRLPGRCRGAEACQCGPGRPAGPAARAQTPLQLCGAHFKLMCASGFHMCPSTSAPGGCF
jgi:hypothetical protein